MLQTRFAPTSTQQKKCMEKTTNLHKRFGKRDNTEIHTDEEQLKKTKCDLKNYRFPVTPVQRKFPGPAGILPDDYVDNKSVSEIFQSDKSNNVEIFLCSQENFSVFAKGPWLKMIADFQDTQRELLFEKFNINWIKAHFTDKKQVKNYKAPFLACILENLELINGKIPTVKVILRDKTGTIEGTILHSLYEEYSQYFTVKTVLILKQFGVLSANNSYCLTITPNNLLSIYYMDTELSNDEKNESKSSKVEKVILQEHSIESIWAIYDSQISGDKSSIKINLYDRNLEFVNKSSMNNVCLKNVNNKNTFIFKSVDKEQIFENFKEISKDVKPCISAVTSDKADMKVWEDLFKEVDTDAFFDEF